MGAWIGLRGHVPRTTSWAYIELPHWGVVPAPKPTGVWKGGSVWTGGSVPVRGKGGGRKDQKGRHLFAVPARGTCSRCLFAIWPAAGLEGTKKARLNPHWVQPGRIFSCGSVIAGRRIRWRTSSDTRRTLSPRLANKR